jgi:membrane protein DedA with SNARE-associated domain
MWMLGGVALFVLVMWPLRPFMIASAPVLLAITTGSKAAIGAVAAFAAVGRYPLWAALVAGVIGMAKFDWLFWWAGRQWGEGALDVFAKGERSKRLVLRAKHTNPWLLRCLIVCGRLPGVPGGVFYAAAGWAGMSLAAFLALDVLGVLIVVGAVAFAGYALGEEAIDLIVLIDNYAIWVTLAIVMAMAFLPVVRKRRREAREATRNADREAARDADREADAETS